MSKQFLNISRSNVSGWGADANYYNEWTVTDNVGAVIAQGVIQQKPLTPTLPKEYAEGWRLPDNFSGMKGRGPLSGLTVWAEKPWFRNIE